jgi:hypothetical protein
MTNITQASKSFDIQEKSETMIKYALQIMVGKTERKGTSWKRKM